MPCSGFPFLSGTIPRPTQTRTCPCCPCPTLYLQFDTFFGTTFHPLPMRKQSRPLPKSRDLTEDQIRMIDVRTIAALPPIPLWQRELPAVPMQSGDFASLHHRTPWPPWPWRACTDEAIGKTAAKNRISMNFPMILIVAPPPDHIPSCLLRDIWLLRLKQNISDTEKSV